MHVITVLKIVCINRWVWHSHGMLIDCMTIDNSIGCLVREIGHPVGKINCSDNENYSRATLLFTTELISMFQNELMFVSIFVTILRSFACLGFAKKKSPIRLFRCLWKFSVFIMPLWTRVQCNLWFCQKYSCKCNLSVFNLESIIKREKRSVWTPRKRTCRF